VIAHEDRVHGFQPPSGCRRSEDNDVGGGARRCCRNSSGRVCVALDVEALPLERFQQILRKIIRRAQYYLLTFQTHESGISV